MFYADMQLIHKNRVERSMQRVFLVKYTMSLLYPYFLYVVYKKKKVKLSKKLKINVVKFVVSIYNWIVL